MDKEYYYNASGYPDPTAYYAMRAIDSERETRERMKRLIGHIFYVAGLAGFRIEGRIKLVDKRTGKRFD